MIPVDPKVFVKNIGTAQAAEWAVCRFVTPEDGTVSLAMSDWVIVTENSRPLVFARFGPALEKSRRLQ